MIRDLFLVTSAINTRFGVFDAATRLEQTLATIKSITARVPTATIVLLEMSAEPLDAETHSKLSSVVTYIMTFHKDEVVKETYSNDNWDIVKNYTELCCFKKALGALDDLKLKFTNDARIFKVSGRYTLTSNFDVEKHHAAAGLVFARRRPSQFAAEVTGGVAQQFMSRCWSFPAAMKDRVKNTFESMIYAARAYYLNGNYIDIEHLLMLYCQWYPVTELKMIGVAGKLGPTGHEVED